MANPGGAGGVAPSSLGATAPNCEASEVPGSILKDREVVGNVSVGQKQQPDLNNNSGSNIGKAGNEVPESSKDGAARAGRPETTTRPPVRNIWKERAENKRKQVEGVMLQFHPTLLGADSISFSEEEWNEAVNDYRFALVGFTFGSTPVLEDMKGFARFRWKGDVAVSLLNPGVFLFNFKDELSKNKALYGEPITYNRRPLIFEPWSEKEDYKVGKADALPVWVKLEGLRVHLQKDKILSKICSMIGRPKFSDGYTALGEDKGYVRVCIEVYANSKLRDSVMFKDPAGNSIKQLVQYDWIPPRCEHCQKFGHYDAQCDKPRTNVVPEIAVENEKVQEDVEELGEEGDWGEPGVGLSVNEYIKWRNGPESSTKGKEPVIYKDSDEDELENDNSSSEEEEGPGEIVLETQLTSVEPLTIANPVNSDELLGNALEAFEKGETYEEHMSKSGKKKKKNKKKSISPQTQQKMNPYAKTYSTKKKRSSGGSGKNKNKSQ